LLNALLPFAQEQLAKHGEFHPFGASMNAQGEIVAQAADLGDESPHSQDLIDTLAATFRRDAVGGRIRAAGICYDVRVVVPGQARKSDAICVSVEHATGKSADVYVPYKKRLLRSISYGEVFSVERTRQFFP
jgi:hypothetical protein